MQIIATTYDGRRFPYRPNTMQGDQPMRFSSMDELESFLLRGVAASKSQSLVRQSPHTIDVLIHGGLRVRYEAA